MNPLGNGNVGLNQGISQNIQQVKQMMKMFNGNPTEIIKQNPMLNQIMQTYRGQNPQQIFMNLCKQRGVDPNAILKELQS